MALVWLAASHPVTPVAAGLSACIGLALIAHVWRQPDAAGRRVPDGPLSQDFRALAEAG